MRMFGINNKIVESKKRVEEILSSNVISEEMKARKIFDEFEYFCRLSEGVFARLFYCNKCKEWEDEFHLMIMEHIRKNNLSIGKLLGFV